MIQSSQKKKIQKYRYLHLLVKDRKGEHHKVFEDLKKKGFIRVRVDGEISNLDSDFELDKNRKHSVEVVVDRLIIRSDEDFKKRLADSVETALELGEGLVIVSYIEDDKSPTIRCSANTSHVQNVELTSKR